MFGNSEESRRAVRVLLVDDHLLYTEALTALLGPEERIEIVGHAADGAEAVELALALQPDVVLMDVYMPNMNGFEATRRIRRKLPSVCVLMLTSSTLAGDVERARRAGAAGYVTKDCAAADLVEAIVEAGPPPAHLRSEWEVAAPYLSVLGVRG